MASPVKDMKKGKYSHSFEGGVGGYTPYKMRGHELPGVKQRGMPYTAGDPLNEEMVDGVSPSSPTPFFGGIFGKAAKRAGKSIADVFKKDEPTEPVAVAPHGDEAHTGGQATASAGFGPGNLFGGTPTGGTGAPAGTTPSFAGMDSVGGGGKAAMQEKLQEHLRQKQNINPITGLRNVSWG